MKMRDSVTKELRNHFTGELQMVAHSEDVIYFRCPVSQILQYMSVSDLRWDPTWYNSTDNNIIIVVFSPAYRDHVNLDTRLAMFTLFVWLQ